MSIARRVIRLASCAALVAAAWTSEAGAMSFQPAAVDGTAAIVATGVITLETPAEFAALPVPPGTALYLNSPGGNVGAAVELGSLFRSRGVTAVVAGVTSGGVPVAGACYSACVYALVGAAHRVVPSRSRVGIHRMHAASEEMAGAYERSEHRAAASTLMGYTAQMGVDPSMIASAERTPSTSIHLLTRGELRRWGIAGGR